MSARQAVDAEEVADDEASEVPAGAQKVGEQGAVGGGGQAVDGVVGCHHRERPGLDGGAEGRQEILVEGTQADAGVAAVLSAVAGAVGYEVLERGDGGVGACDVATAETADECRADLRRQARILAHRFFYARPSGLACKVEHGAVADVAALQAHFLADYLTCLA